MTLIKYWQNFCTLNCLLYPVSPSLVLLSRLMTILKLGAVISVSPHNISSFSASWMKLYWAYVQEGIEKFENHNNAYIQPPISGPVEGK